MGHAHHHRRRRLRQRNRHPTLPVHHRPALHRHRLCAADASDRTHSMRIRTARVHRRRRRADVSRFAVGGWKTRDAVPMLVEKAIKGEIPLEHFITHEYKGVQATTKALTALHSGDCLRAVVTY